MSAILVDMSNSLICQHGIYSVTVYVFPRVHWSVMFMT